MGKGALDMGLAGDADLDLVLVWDHVEPPIRDGQPAGLFRSFGSSTNVTRWGARRSRGVAAPAEPGAVRVAAA